MASTAQLTAMQGVLLVAAELWARGLVVSTTSRNAMGADLLVTDSKCKRTWSIQVTTNKRSASFWLVGEKAKTLVSKSHIYVLVNLHLSDGAHEYCFLTSRQLSVKGKKEPRRNSTWYPAYRDGLLGCKDRWELLLR